MSYGNCCLTSDIEECAQVVEDKGVLFPRGNVAALRGKLQELLDNPRQVAAYKAEAQEFILSKYNWDEVVRRTLDLYQKK